MGIKVKGRKRHIAVNVLGLVLECHVSAANESDAKVAHWVLLWVVEQYERIEKILGDQEYRGDFGRDWEAIYGVVLETTQDEGKGFTVEAKR